MTPTRQCDQCGLVHARCGAHQKGSRGTVPCGSWPIKGGDKCRMHGGGKASPTGRAAAKRLALEALEAEVGRERERRNGLGMPVVVDAAEEMLAMVGEASGNVGIYRRLVQQLAEDVLPPADVFDEDGNPVALHLGEGIAGRVGPDNWKAERHVLVAMYDDERERLMRFAKMCRDAGVDERRVAIAEEQGRQIADVLGAAVGALFAAVSALLESGQMSVEALRRVEREEAPAIVRRVIEARVLGGAA